MQSHLKKKKKAKQDLCVHRTVTYNMLLQVAEISCDYFCRIREVKNEHFQIYAYTIRCLIMFCQICALFQLHKCDTG